MLKKGLCEMTLEQLEKAAKNVARGSAEDMEHGERYEVLFPAEVVGTEPDPYPKTHKWVIIAFAIEAEKIVAIPAELFFGSINWGETTKPRFRR